MADSFTAFDSRYGHIIIFWTRRTGVPKVSRIFLDSPKADSRNNIPKGSIEESCSAVDGLADGIHAFFLGESVEFDLGILDLDCCFPFQREVLLTEFRIPRGYVSTYGRIACEVGMPTGSRAVGNALARNPFPVVIPCHRAVRSDGALGGFQGGLDMKYELLKMEGVGFDGRRRASLSRVYY